MSQPKILIVDDEPFNIDYLEQELEDCGCETISAANGLEALEKIQSGQPDLVLLDIMMPGMDGFEVLQRLRADPANRELPVIIISADSNLQSIVRGIQLGAEDYLPKPFEPVLLHARITTSLEKKRLSDLQQVYLKGLERELEIGRQIQLGFLPTELPRVSGWELAAWFKAAHEVAGDFYDAFPLPGGCLACVTGDVCDKGVGAALFMTLFRSLIRATSTSDVFCSRQGQSLLAPGERLQQVISFTNQYLCETHGDTGMFATIFMGIFEPDGWLTYVNCGNEPPLLVEPGGAITALQPTGPVVGAIPGATFTTTRLPMPPGALLLAFTDGVTDALDASGAPFGHERLRSLLGRDTLAPRDLLQALEADLKVFTGPALQYDDITVLAVRRE